MTEITQGAGATVGEQLQQAVSIMLRWASRSEVRAELFGPQQRALSLTDLWLLEAIVTDGPIRASDLAAWQGVDKSTVTPQLRRIEQRGLIARKPDPRDNRAALLTATAAGRRLHRKIVGTGLGCSTSCWRTGPSRTGAPSGRCCPDSPSNSSLGPKRDDGPCVLVAASCEEAQEELVDAATELSDTLGGLRSAEPRRQIAHLRARLLASRHRLAAQARLLEPGGELFAVLPEATHRHVDRARTTFLAADSTAARTYQMLGDAIVRLCRRIGVVEEYTP